MNEKIEDLDDKIIVAVERKDLVETKPACIKCVNGI